MCQSTRWCYTLNNYTEPDETILQAIECTYHVYGKECGSKGTPHLQGFITFKTNKRFSAMKKLHPQCHWEITKFTSIQASEYCKKEYKAFERGEPPKSGSRSDLAEIYGKIKEGISDRELAEKYPSQFSRYFKAFAKYRSTLPVEYPSVEKLYPLFPWQQELNTLLSRRPSLREIVFVVDENGNNGKTWFSLYYSQLNPGLVQIMKPGKKADMAYELRVDIKALFMDCPRSRSDVLDYEFLESLKDQIVFSPKYESMTKILKEPIHVIVFMNEWPDTEKLTEDRYTYISTK